LQAPNLREKTLIIILIVSAAASAGEPAAPFSLELEFKKPTLLPNRLEVTGGAGYTKDAAAGEQGVL
jgi:hypothetical protein